MITDLRSEVCLQIKGPLKYLITLFIIGVATCLQWFLWPLINPAPFIFYYPAIILSALYGDGLSAIFLSAVIAQWLFVPPSDSLSIMWPGDVVRLAAFLFAAFMIRNLTKILSTALAESREQKRKLDNILQNSLDAVVGMNASGYISLWSAQAEKIFGYTYQEAIGQRMSKMIIPQQYRDAHEQGLKHYMKTGIGPVLNQRIEITALRKDGTEFPIELAITPSLMDGEKYFSAFIRDIAAQKRLAKDLVLKSDALENSLNGFDIVNSKGEMIYANPAYLKMWGYDHLDEIKGMSPTTHCADPGIPAKIIRELKEKGECNIEFLARRKDGSTFDVHMWARLAHDVDGQEIYPTTSIDITERKRAENALKEAIAARDEFISVCSHELKTPVTSMKLQFQLAERQYVRGDEKIYDRAHVQRRIINANRQLDRMTNLIEEMLDVSKMGAGKLQLRLSKINLSELVLEVVDRFIEQFQIVGTELQADIAPSIEINGDRYRIEQVLSNLLTNAIKYSPGKPVTVRVAKKPDSAIIYVQDQGIGIARENHEKIFQRFERATASSNISGLGLGLYISKQMVEAHHGKIRVDSEMGKGSTFTVELPLN